MKRSQFFYGVVAVLVLLMAIAGCEFMNDRQANPVIPAGAGLPAEPGLSDHPANFYVTSGTADYYGVYLGKGKSYFMANVPRAGVYLLTYNVKYGGTFHLVTKVKKNSLLYVGLMPGAEIWSADILEGDLSPLASTSPEIQDFGNVIVYYRPGFIGTWTNFFVVNPTKRVVILIQDGVVLVSDWVKTLNTKGIHITQKTKKTKKT